MVKLFLYYQYRTIYVIFQDILRKVVQCTCTALLLFREAPAMLSRVHNLICIHELVVLLLLYVLYTIILWLSYEKLRVKIFVELVLCYGRQKYSIKLYCMIKKGILVQRYN